MTANKQFYRIALLFPIFVQGCFMRTLFILAAVLLSFSFAWAETGFDEKYERDYNIFNPANQYAPDNPLNPAQTYAPDNPFNNRVRPALLPSSKWVSGTLLGDTWSGQVD